MIVALNCSHSQLHASHMWPLPISTTNSIAKCSEDILQVITFLYEIGFGHSRLVAWLSQNELYIIAPAQRIYQEIEIKKSVIHLLPHLHKSINNIPGLP